MDVLPNCSRYRVLFTTLLCGVLLCLFLKSVLERWAVQQIVSDSLPLGMNDSLFDFNRGSIQDAEDGNDFSWKAEYESRVQRVRDICNSDETIDTRRVWRAHTNRLNGQKIPCPTKLCPIIVDEQQILFCFIPKVASSHIKMFFLNISNIPINDTLKSNGSVMHVVANDALRRISTMYYPSTKFNHFYKMVFVRHPFDRLVSAFRSKAERSRDEVPYFYNRYWDPIMLKLRPKGSTLDHITFKEFVWYLLHTDKRDYDEHWTPFWSRCNPCLVDYDFIGKLETAEHDFLYAFREAGVEFSPEWWTGFQPTPHGITLRYFTSVPEDMIRSLFEIYKLDFELFGYTVDEFFSGNLSVI